MRDLISLIEAFGDVDYTTDKSRRDAAQRICNQVKRFAKNLPITVELRPEIRYDTCRGIVLTDLFALTPGQGTGTIVMNKLLELAEKAELNVYTDAEGPRSCDYYKKLGFSDCNQGHQLVWYPPFDIDEYLNESAENPKIYTRRDLEQMDIDDLDRMAFGHAGGDIVELSPSQIRIKYRGDLANPIHKFEKGGMDWVRSVDFSQPIEISVNDKGQYDLEDGHHRLFAAKKLKRKLKAVLEIKGRPIEMILKRQAARLNATQ